jgi:hypothetical protein
MSAAKFRRKWPAFGEGYNLDNQFSEDELMDLWADFNRPTKDLLALLWPGRKEPPSGARRALKDMANYASNKATAMRERLKGAIPTAQMYESICERIYDDLPDWARW